jgi:CMP/dCMP kinase
MAVITVSRQYGSGGDEIAARVCEILGYRYFDKRLMAQVASQMGLPSKDVIDSQEERHELLTFFDRIFGHKVTEAWVTTDPVTGARTVDVGELDSRRYVAVVRDLIHAACGQDDVVIMGRGGQVILKDQPGVLHVRFEASFEERVRRVSEQQRFSNPAAARDFVAGRDRAGADYIRTYYGVDWNSPELYHLILNTGLWDIESAAQIIVDAVKRLK